MNEPFSIAMLNYQRVFYPENSYKNWDAQLSRSLGLALIEIGPGLRFKWHDDMFLFVYYKKAITYIYNYIYTYTKVY